jgi:hypothetical protein
MVKSIEKVRISRMIKIKKAVSNRIETAQ